MMLWVWSTVGTLVALKHSGAKKGAGAYWGRKAAAKHQSNRKRRANAKRVVRDEDGNL
jgi:hypothetical protein